MAKDIYRIYPNSIGEARGTHLSVLFLIIPGEHDCFMPWPFRQKVTFKLKNQSEGDDVIVEREPHSVNAFTEGPLCDVINGWEVTKFCPLAMFLPGSPYTKSNVVYIECAVAPLYI